MEDEEKDEETGEYKTENVESMSTTKEWTANIKKNG